MALACAKFPVFLSLVGNFWHTASWVRRTPIQAMELRASEVSCLWSIPVQHSHLLRWCGGDQVICLPQWGAHSLQGTSDTGWATLLLHQNPKAKRKKVMQIMFEISSTLDIQARLLPYAFGCTTSTVMDLGNRVAQRVLILPGLCPSLLTPSCVWTWLSRR